ncbi:MAG TPA: energy transducer TonB, partial [Parafilimonas sp.]|nr:energy transducer TonB [Parafilimonas sp.]
QEQQTNFNPPPTVPAQAETQPEVAENDEADATPIVTSPKPQVKKQVAVENNDNKKVSTQTVVNPTPTPPKPKAVYAGGTSAGSGGNNADTYNNSRNQGIAGGNGDQGKPNGNPNSDSYTGNGGTGTAGISITNGLQGRRISSSAHFQDAYKYGGKVSVDVTVDENGSVTSARVKPGSPFADLNAIAVKRAYQLKFNKGDTPQSGTIQIIFQNPKG